MSGGYVIPCKLLRTPSFSEAGVCLSGLRTGASDCYLHLDEAVEDGLFDVGVGEAATAVLREGGGVDDAIGERKTKEPRVCNVDLHLPHELALGADAKEVTDEEHLEQLHGIDGGSAIVGGVEMRGGVTNEVKWDVTVDQMKQVIRRNQLFKRDHFQSVLVRYGRFEHASIQTQSPHSWGLCQQS